MICGKLCFAPEGDYFAVCSFDKNHIVLRSRMPYHIVKCIKRYPGHNKIQCPYDATEYIDPDDYPEHILKCESAESLGTCNEKFELARLRETGNLCNSERDPPPFHHKYAPEATEDWGGAKEPDHIADEKLIMRGVTIEDDLKEDYLTKGVGRGTKKRGKGRAEILARLMKQYEEQNALRIPSSYTSSDRSSGSSVSPGQFDDK